MSVEVVLLGLAQDGGLPQAGCACPRCRRAWTDPGYRRNVVSLGLVDHDEKSFWMVDASPDFRGQLHSLETMAPGCELRGIFLTHAHIGHYSGLVHLGKEAMHTRRLPLYASASMVAFLAHNAPWSQLVEIGNVELHPLSPGQTVRLSARLSLRPIPVPHRAEYSDTVAYLAAGEQEKLLYCPDIDAWSQGGFDVNEFLQEVDFALLDGTFFSPAEVPGRDLDEIPHPTVQESAALLAGLEAEVNFIHLNHTNPLWDPGPERDWLLGEGHQVGEQGQRWLL